MSKKMQSNILLLITAIIWGSAFVAQKSGMDYIEPFTFNGIRTFIGGLVLIPVIMVMNKKSPEENLTKEELSGSIHIVAPDSICDDMINSHYIDFHEKYPSISIRFTTGDSALMLDMLDHSIDCRARAVIS